MSAPCPCGEAYPPLTPRQIRDFSELRGREISVCQCGHEVMALAKAHDVRKIGFIGASLAHLACARLAAKPRSRKMTPTEILEKRIACAAWVDNPGSVLSRNCVRLATWWNDKGQPVCPWHKNGRITRDRAPADPLPGDPT